MSTEPLLAKALILARPEAKMNRTEAAYSAYLLSLLHGGFIRSFDFEPEKFRLGPDCFYTPDFRIVEVDMSISFMDTKGTTKKNGKEKPYYRDKSIIKMKLAAELHPMYRWGMAWKTKGGWDSKIF